MESLIITPPRTTPAPVVVDSPHSGMDWPADFHPSASRESIFTTWDAFVDELWGDAPDAGATLIAATFPRAYIDANRSESDIDAELLATAWPGPISATSYTQRGMGLIRRYALPGIPMYAEKLSVAEVRHRIEVHYRPYRAALARALDEAHARFGVVCHVDCHSMKSKGNAMNVDAGASRPDLVISDRLGATASPALTAWAAEYFRGLGYRVQINDPYKGGDLVATFGRPASGRHSLQIEVNRALYMDEKAFVRSPNFGRVKADFAAFVRAVAIHIRSLTP